VPERRITVTSPVGLHARPAAQFAEAAAATKTVLVRKPGGRAANASSILSLLSLDIRNGDQIFVQAEGENAEAVLDQLVNIATSADPAHG
jgi:phosphocarrier protein HPr